MFVGHAKAKKREIFAFGLLVCIAFVYTKALHMHNSGGRVLFEGFDWDAGNIEKCQQHGLSIAEIESVFLDRVLILDDTVNSETERCFRAIGTSAIGRKTFIVFTMRGSFIRPLSARYMHRKEVDRYEKDNPDV